VGPLVKACQRQLSFGASGRASSELPHNARPLSAPTSPRPAQHPLTQWQLEWPAPSPYARTTATQPESGSKSTAGSLPWCAASLMGTHQVLTRRVREFRPVRALATRPRLSSPDSSKTGLAVGSRSWYTVRSSADVAVQEQTALPRAKECTQGTLRWQLEIDKLNSRANYVKF
jgi:hypothetical protein